MLHVQINRLRFFPQSVLHDFFQYFVSEVATDRHSRFRDDQFEIVDGLNMWDGYDVRLMDPEKTVFTQIVFDIFKEKQGGVFAFTRSSLESAADAILNPITGGPKRVTGYAKIDDIHRKISEVQVISMTSFP